MLTIRTRNIFMKNEIINNIQWLAGLLEGEGCFMVGSSGRLTVNLTMTDLDVVEKFQGIVGVGSVYVEALRENRKQAYTWRIGNRREVKSLIEALQPHMGVRRSAKIQCMLDWFRDNPPKRQEKGNLAHGTRTRYARGCRCSDCRGSESAYSIENRLRKRQ